MPPLVYFIIRIRVFVSIILLAIVDSDYTFVWCDLGGWFKVWEHSDADIYFGKLRTTSEACTKLLYRLHVCVPNRKRKCKILLRYPTHYIIHYVIFQIM